MKRKELKTIAEREMMQTELAKAPRVMAKTVASGEREKCCITGAIAPLIQTVAADNQVTH